MPIGIRSFLLKNCLYCSFLLACLGCKSQNGEARHGDHSYTNELIHESSPYLLQHAHNPVNWQPWNDKALQKAKEENKLILVSIGYAACHWCHVMEHESFEDTAVANLMNKYFITIKVDREERPDVDDVYMSACQLASQQGCGWPLNAFALPDGKPVWAGTYFPRKKWIEILEYFQGEWEKNPEKMKEYAAQLTQGVGKLDDVPKPDGEAEFTQNNLDQVADNFFQRIDYQNGGRKGAPKFPIPNNYQFLLEYHHLTGNQEALRAVTVTLDHIAAGGINDHLGGGFARYSTDDKWLVPHFEKMLYDNAQLVSLYSQAFQVTKNPLYKKVVEETLGFVKNEMTAKEGAFYSSLDADSDGEEGKFYVWEKQEVDSILGDAKVSAAFCDFFEITQTGNWEDGKNILHRKKTAAEVAKKHGLSEDALNQLITAAKGKLLKARSARIRPTLDDKALTAWNALMLKGYVDAYRALGDNNYLAAALQSGQFILDKMMQPDNRLNRNYKDGKAVINAFLDDYALTIDAFTDLYQVTFDEKWLNKAKALATYALAHFYDDESGLFYYTSDLDPPLIARKMETSDNVIPASNSVMAKDLFLLGLYFYENDWLEKARGMMHLFADRITTTKEPDFFSNWCQLYLDLVRPPFEVAIVGNDFGAKRDALLRNYLPNAILLGGQGEGTLELLKDKLQAGQTMIYVCRNKVCKLPVTEPEKALQLME
ncbi:MAG: thioredoxin domain-containing protein [Saprospiraceae bacterium]